MDVRTQGVFANSHPLAPLLSRIAFRSQPPLGDPALPDEEPRGFRLRPQRRKQTGAEKSKLRLLKQSSHRKFVRKTNVRHATRCREKCRTRRMLRARAWCPAFRHDAEGEAPDRMSEKRRKGRTFNIGASKRALRKKANSACALSPRIASSSGRRM